MLPEQKRVRQMTAVVRLRALQRAKSELLYAQSLNALQQSEATLREQQDGYGRVVEQFQQRQSVGLALDPLLHEHRLQALVTMHTAVLEQTTRVDEARTSCQETKSAFNDARIDERAAQNAYEQARKMLRWRQEAQESVDIFDAQQTGGCRHGH